MAFPAIAQAPPAPVPLTFADLADIAVDAPVIARLTIVKAINVEPERAPGLAPGAQRFYVQGRLAALIRGQSGLPDSVTYLVDLPRDARGKPPKLKKRDVIIFARNGNRPGELQLAAPDAQIDWSADRDARIRQLIREVVARDAAPAIKRIGSAFHVPGTILGEGETQIFLETVRGDPISITVLSRAGQRKIWAVSLGEIVDEAAKPPVPGSLLWYRLACFLPQSLPPAALRGDDANNMAQASTDYAMVRKALGACPRSRTAPSVVR
ncbi:MAG: hypothetical protein U5J78_01555 [Parasphingorhabdus sp.]|nr:hypothetical protein [Parasphingorhabdus sp.]